jgi:tetratricopeptide (TPR) repeat protein
MDCTGPIISGMPVFHCHLLKHEDKGMMAKYEKAASVKPRNADIQFNLGNGYSRAQRYAEAAKAFSLVTRLTPQDARAHYMLGECYVRLQHRKLALAQYRRLKDLDAGMAANLSSLIAETQ